MKNTFLLFALLLLGCICFADGTTTSTLVNLNAPDAQDLQSLVGTVVTAKTAGILGLVAVLVQLLMFAIKWKFADLGKWNLLIVMGLNGIFGVLILHNNGVEWMEALLHSQTMAAVQIMLHQAKVQFLEKEEPKA